MGSQGLSHVVGSQSGNGNVTASRNLANAMSTSGKRPAPFAATPRTGGLGGSIRSAISPRAREAREAAVAVRGTQAQAAAPTPTSPNLRPRGTRSPCSVRATSSPLNCDVSLRGRSRVESVRATVAFDPPQRSVRGEVATQRRVPAKQSADRHAQAAVVAVPVQVAPLRAVALAQAGAAESDAQSSSVPSAQKSARIEQMSAVAQSLQAAAMALQRVATVNPTTGGGRGRGAGISARQSAPQIGRADAASAAGGEQRAKEQVAEGTRDATAAKLAGAAQRVRADWLGGGSGGGMLSQLSRENAALREALDDTTRKLNALEGEKMRLAADVDSPGSQPDTAEALPTLGVEAEPSSPSGPEGGDDDSQLVADGDAGGTVMGDGDRENGEGGKAESAVAEAPTAKAQQDAAVAGVASATADGLDSATRAKDALQTLASTQATAAVQAMQVAEARAALVEAVTAAVGKVEALRS